MVHHGVIHQREAHPFAVVKLNGLSGLRKFLAIKAPHIALHVAGEVKFDFPTGWP